MVKLPTKPDNLVWTGFEQFGDCKYVYVRFQDHSRSASSPEYLKEMMDTIFDESAASVREGGAPHFGLNVSPWLAEMLYLYTNCELFGVTTSGVNKPVLRSKQYAYVRPGSVYVQQQLL
ncbi:hypothetical protein TIN4_57 [Tsukamurella phage TIN4]|uniref:Uncharacterized protein n=2 Tax=Tinduovirus TIN3 TaxID=1982571 RepID=A0A0K0N636_9CAUD|nr:hypothetical protein AVT54_gp068 [Tsukamurella phage TIN3]YP_009604187.1 hypothetical protein FDH87_gp068 [Tsukamurella phage TIN4]AKJ71854.1 hypothetical protein TIN3_57 [Tsukamurella phage TIN3]AKJ71963.1 hypothetical protein TIN4_57 [Tsukamurella phage TIN4]